MPTSLNIKNLSIWKTPSKKTVQARRMQRPMSAGDIAMLYTQARDKANQISVLADLNNCCALDIIHTLRKQGIEPTVKRYSPQKPRYDWVKAFKLYEDGAEDIEIAASIGCSIQSVEHWRYEYRLL